MKKHFRRFISLALILVFFQAGLPGVPVGGIGTAYGFSIGDERKVGEKLLAIVRKEFKLLDEPDISQYVAKLGDQLLAAAGPQYFEYHFFVVKNKEFNAFAAPSGLIFFHSGLIEVMQAESELVSVMAHEVGHVVSRHIAERMRKSAKVNVGTAALLLAGIAMGGGAVSEALITGSMAANASMNLKFSRQDEEEADRLAFKWMQEEGRDPVAIVSMLRTMRRINQFRSGNVPPYLLTHPEPAIRLGYIQDLVLFSEKGEYKPVDDFVFNRFKGRVLSLSSEPATQIAIYEKKITAATGDSPVDIMVYYGLSQAYLAVGQFDKASEALERVLKVYPGQPLLTVDQGVIKFAAGQYPEAHRLFEQAVAADQNCGYASYNLARSYEQQGQVGKAEELYNKLLVVLPDYTELYYRLSMIKAGKGEQGVAYYYMGIYNWYEGEPDKAKENLQRALKELVPDHPSRSKVEELLTRIREAEKE